MVLTFIPWSMKMPGECVLFPDNITALISLIIVLNKKPLKNALVGIKT